MQSNKPALNGKVRYTTRRYKCPHCGSCAKVRSSKEESKLVTKRYLQCQNIECGHTYATMEEIVHTITPSAMPDPSVNLEVRGITTKTVNG